MEAIGGKMQITLNQIATVYSGATSRYFHKSNASHRESIDVITAENLSSNGILNVDKRTQRWVDTPFLAKFYLMEGDILVQLRGSDFKASVVCDFASNHNLSVNSNLAIVRLQANTLAPEIVCFYLNSNFFYETVIKKTQSNLILINVGELKKIKLPYASSDTQENVKALYYDDLELTKKHKALLEAQHAITEAKFFEMVPFETAEETYKETPKEESI